MTSPPPDASDRTPVTIPAGTLRGWAHMLEDRANGRGSDPLAYGAGSVARAIRAVLDEQTGERR